MFFKSPDFGVFKKKANNKLECKTLLKSIELTQRIL